MPGLKPCDHNTANAEAELSSLRRGNAHCDSLKHMSLALHSASVGVAARHHTSLASEARIPSRSLKCAADTEGHGPRDEASMHFVGVVQRRVDVPRSTQS